MMDFSNTWKKLLDTIMTEGSLVSPRGMPTRELLQHTITVDMRYPVLTVPYRKLNYKFMAAEAFWILTGDDRVSTIAPYNSRIAQFSDGGVTFFGAYGPKIVDQIEYVVDKLIADNDTRQAGLTIWRENPPDTKDVPCTVAIFFNIRQDKLNAHVFMRSSDAWLGVPYDVFNFSMLAHLICGLLHKTNGLRVEPGSLYLTAASSHLYATNWDMARDCLRGETTPSQGRTPQIMFEDPQYLLDALKALRDSRPGDKLRWWEVQHAT